MYLNYHSPKVFLNFDEVIVFNHQRNYVFQEKTIVLI